MTKLIQDPDLYARMTEPHENLETAQVVLDAFQKDLAALREKYRIPELVVLYSVNLVQDGQTVPAVGAYYRGSQPESERLVKFAFYETEAGRAMLNAIQKLA